MAKLISHKYDKSAIVFGYKSYKNIHNNTMVYPRNSRPITDDEIAEFYEILKALKVPQLKVICKERELMVSGNKGELITRLLYDKFDAFWTLSTRKKNPVYTISHPIRDWGTYQERSLKVQTWLDNKLNAQPRAPPHGN